jgi:hypothetical protein
MSTYIPTYSQEDEALPEPTGVFGKIIAAQKSHETQRYEANKLLDFIQTEGTNHYNSLATTATPLPLLIKVPGTHTVRFITGLAPFVHDIFSQEESPLTDQLLAIVQDIDNINEEAVIIRLPPNILKVSAVMAPTEEKFINKVRAGEDTLTNTSWFQQNSVKDNTVDVAKVAPLPPYLAYDAFTGDVPAHEIWERILMADDEGLEKVFDYTKNFLMAVHVNYNVTNRNNLQVDSQFFMERQSMEAKEWGKLRTSIVYPSVITQRQKEKGTASVEMTSALTQMIGQQNNDKNNNNTPPAQTQQSTSTDVADQNYKKYGMSENDIARTLQLCGLTTGQEDQLPEWFTQIAEKNLSTDGKRSIIKILFTGNIPYEEHDIPATPTILDLAIKRTWIGDGDAATATGVMKGLSPYLFDAITSEEVEEETNFADAVRNSSASTVQDIQKLKQKKATAPSSHQALVATLKTFANALERLFTGRGPLYMVLRANLITPLTKMSKLAKSLMNKTTLASIMWGCYKQSQHYALGQMTGPTALVAEWQIMTQNILGGAQDFKFLEVPLAISGNPVELDNKTKKPKPNAGSPTPSSPNADTPTIPPKRRKILVKIHPTIKAKITSILPDKLNLRKLASVCNIPSARAIFPQSDICVPTALTGKCPYSTCRNNHDPDKITDELAEAAVSVLDPAIRNPLSLNEGQ